MTDYTLDHLTDAQIDNIRSLITGAIIMAAVETTDTFIGQFYGKVFNEVSNIQFNVGIMLRGQDIIDALNRKES